MRHYVVDLETLQALTTLCTLTVLHDPKHATLRLRRESSSIPDYFLIALYVVAI